MGRGGTKKRVNRLLQKFDQSAQIEIFVVYHDVLIKENIIFFHFQKVFSAKKIAVSVTRPERPKGAKDEVKPARRATK